MTDGVEKSEEVWKCTPLWKLLQKECVDEREILSTFREQSIWSGNWLATEGRERGEWTV